jgi:hypothetical protein
MLTTEREAKIRRNHEGHGAGSGCDSADLLAELDETRRERDQAEATARALVQEALKELDETRERVARLEHISEEQTTCVRTADGVLAWELRTRDGSEIMPEVRLAAEHFAEGTTITIREPLKETIQP